jgi:hypothetical protein
VGDLRHIIRSYRLMMICICIVCRHETSFLAAYSHAWPRAMTESLMAPRRGCRDRPAMAPGLSCEYRRHAVRQIEGVR